MPKTRLKSNKKLLSPVISEPSIKKRLKKRDEPPDTVEFFEQLLSGELSCED